MEKKKPNRAFERLKELNNRLQRGRHQTEALYGYPVTPPARLTVPVKERKS